MIINDLRGIGLKNLDPGAVKFIMANIFPAMPVRVGKIWYARRERARSTIPQLLLACSLPPLVPFRALTASSHRLTSRISSPSCSPA